jgi:hypothetical protein
MNDLAPGFGCLPHLDRSGGYCGWASVAGPAYAGNDLNPFENAALRLNAESPIEERARQMETSVLDSARRPGYKIIVYT